MQSEDKLKALIEIQTDYSFGVQLQSSCPMGTSGGEYTKAAGSPPQNNSFQTNEQESGYCGIPCTIQ